MDKVKLSISQIQKMQHAIGFSPMLRQSRYKAYRNRYIVSKPDDDWEELVIIGYATKRKFEIEKQIAYYVSDLGMKYLGVLFGCIITEVIDV